MEVPSDYVRAPPLHSSPLLVRPPHLFSRGRWVRTQTRAYISQVQRNFKKNKDARASVRVCTCVRVCVCVCARDDEESQRKRKREKR